MKKTYLLPLTLILTAVCNLNTYAASDSETETKTKFQFTPHGRILMDGALFLPDGNGFSDGVAIPEIRLGGEATYGKFAAKFDIGYNMSKLSLKDVYMQYKADDHDLFRLGYFVHHFGLNAATGSSTRPAMETPISDSFFNVTGRNLGLMYVRNCNKYFIGVSAFASPTSLSTYANEQGKISVGGMGRFIYRPVHTDGNVAHVGLSLSYQNALHTKTTNENGEIVPSTGYFNFSTGFPTRVDNVSMLGANVQNSRGVFKLSPEFVVAKGRVGLEGQYYYMNVNRKNGYQNYTANGAYGFLRLLLVGDKQYSYSNANAGLAIPKPKTLECVVGYDYTNANSYKGNVFGGISNDYSVTFNYYLNKYITTRLRWSYTDVRGSAVQSDRHVNIIQARVMFLF